MSRLIGLLAGLALVGAAGAQSLFQENTNYLRVDPAQPTDDPSKVEVVEVFGYTCPHCANFQNYIHPWSEEAPDHVKFTRIPVVFNASWEPFARAYYTAQAMGFLDKSHPALFRALHVERKRLRTNDDIAEFFESEFGIDKAEYMKTATSFGIDTKIRRGMSLAQRFGVDATPTLVVNGKYRATATMAEKSANPYPRFIELLDFLVAQEASTLSDEESQMDAGESAAAEVETSD